MIGIQETRRAEAFLNLKYVSAKSKQQQKKFRIQ